MVSSREPALGRCRPPEQGNGGRFLAGRIFAFKFLHAFFRRHEACRNPDQKRPKKSLKVVLVPGFPPPLWEDPVIPRNRASSQSGLEP